MMKAKMRTVVKNDLFYTFVFIYEVIFINKTYSNHIFPNFSQATN